MDMNDYDDFANAARSLLASNRSGNDLVSHLTLIISSGWSWVEHKSVAGHGYATKITRRTNLSQSCSEAEAGDTSLEDHDDAACASKSSGLTIQWYIVFSRTYLVPMLMFQAWEDEGTILSLEDIMANAIVRGSSAGADDTAPHLGHLLLPDSEFPLLQQTEHPTTGQIMWSIHPCNVRQAVETIVPENERSSERWLETWLMLSSTLVDFN